MPIENMAATVRQHNVSETWLRQMGEGAALSGITIQYCMSLSSHILQSLQIPTVTQVFINTFPPPGQK